MGVFICLSETVIMVRTLSHRYQPSTTAIFVLLLASSGNKARIHVSGLSFAGIHLYLSLRLIEREVCKWTNTWSRSSHS